MLEGPEEMYIDFSENPKGEYKLFIRDKIKNDPKVAKRVKPVSKDH
jgi:hypothetical protein